MTTSRTIPLAIIIGGIIVAVAVYLTVSSSAPSTSSGRGNPALVRPVGSDDHILGNPSAPVKIVEYSDYDCTFCKTYEKTLAHIVSTRGADGSVAWVYRHFPLTELHPNAEKHAYAAECAAKVGGNDAFWKFSEALFDAQPADPNTYGSLAREAGVPLEAFQSCYARAATEVGPRVAADRKNAIDTGAGGTPYALLLVDGKAPIVLDGAYSADALNLLIDQALLK